MQQIAFFVVYIYEGVFGVTVCDLKLEVAINPGAGLESVVLKHKGGIYVK